MQKESSVRIFPVKVRSFYNENYEGGYEQYLCQIIDPNMLFVLYSIDLYEDVDIERYLSLNTPGIDPKILIIGY